MIRSPRDCSAKGHSREKERYASVPGIPIAHSPLKEMASLGGMQGGHGDISRCIAMTGIIHVQDDAQASPHLYVKSLKSDTWVRPKGIGLFPVVVGYPSGESRPVPRRTPEIMFWG